MHRIIYYFPTVAMKLNPKIFYFKSRKPTTNDKSIHFIMNNKELNEEEVQSYI